MCGIASYIGNKKAIRQIMTGLKALEYRGYDSAGIAYVKNKKIEIIKSVGPIKNLEDKLNYDEEVYAGIAHTRWATHGEATEINSHPHNCGKITLVHNGIIENYEELKRELIKKGYQFKSSTDTEVVAVFLDYLYRQNNDMLTSLAKLAKVLQGSYALNILCDDNVNAIYGIRKDSPLIIGIGDNENMMASDIPGLLHLTNKYIVLDNYNIVYMTKDEVKIYDESLKEITKEVKTFSGDIELISKNGYDHFMLKEINEEPECIKRLLNLYTDGKRVKGLPDISKYRQIHIASCGSAAFAGKLGKYYIEKLKNIPVTVSFASEYRYQKNFYTKDTLVILISQSGETADTLAALKLAKENNVDTLAIVNRKDSSIAREAKNVIYTESGIEVAVATTKAYFSQVIVLLLLAIQGSLVEEEVISNLKILPSLITKYINDYDYYKIAKEIANKEHIFYLGRGLDYALCEEGSLKLKEISYIHSEAFQAGELKHGSISLVDEKFGIIAVVTAKELKEKTISNLKEVAARKAKIIAITNIQDDNFADEKILLDDYDEIINPLLAIVPMQMLAYNTAKLKGCDIDKPRNLAKSVTVAVSPNKKYKNRKK